MHSTIFDVVRFLSVCLSHAGNVSKPILKLFDRLVATSLPAWSGKMPVLNLLTSQKSAFFAPRRLVPPIQVKIDMAEGAVGSHGRTKYRANRSTGVGRRPPQNWKFPHYANESSPPRGGRTVWPICTVVEGFYTPNYPANQSAYKSPQFRVLHLTWFVSWFVRHSSYCWETVRRSFTRNFPCALSEKLCVGSKNDNRLF